MQSFIIHGTWILRTTKTLVSIEIFMFNIKISIETSVFVVREIHVPWIRNDCIVKRDYPPAVKFDWNWLHVNVYHGQWGRKRGAAEKMCGPAAPRLG